jgi:microcin C transport system permease protein
MIPTLIGITLLSFVIMNLAPGGPVERELQKIYFSGGEGSGLGGSSSNGAGALSEADLEALKKQFGFDKPLFARYFHWLKNVVVFDFGDSFSYQEPVIDVIVRKIPVSLQFGVISFLLTYLICIPLGVLKAIKVGTPFDTVSSFILFVLYSVPAVMLGILLIVFFAGGSFMQWFPLGGVYSDQYFELSLFDKIIDRIHHFVLPLICYMIGSFTVLTFLMKNSLLDEVKNDYIRTARAKGLSEKTVIYKHALRNALIPIATGIGSFLGVFFAGSVVIEQIFSLDGMGLLGFKAALERDYPVLMGLFFIQSIILLLGRLISDLAYTVVDPRIDFN